MADSKISALTSGGALAAGDTFVVVRAGADLKLPGLPGASALVYRYTVTGSDKASIDTGVDTADAGSNDWTNGDLLEIWLIARTDDAAASGTINVTLNNDTGSNYDRTVVSGAGTSTPTSGQNTATASWGLSTHGSGGSASYPGITRISIPDFAGTTFFKMAEAILAKVDATAGNNSAALNGLGYRSTSAITRVAVAASAGQKLKVGSQLLIYKRLNA